MPSYPDFHRYYHHRRPSRFLWFAVGAATAALLVKHHQMRSDEQRFGLCRRASIQALHAPLQSHDTNATTSQSWSFGEPQQAQQWEEDKARLMALSRQAGDAVSMLPFQNEFVAHAL